MLLAVLEERAAVSTGGADVYALAAGGVKVLEPGADLAIALAVASASAGIALADDVVVCAEVGLGGELRHPARLGRRLAEAARLGFTRAVVPAGGPEPPSGLAVTAVSTLADAVMAVLHPAERTVARRRIA
jgi:DNA repair protein RadA/Sms